MILSVKLITFRISENKIYSMHMISIKTRWYCIGVFGNDIIFMVQVIFMLIHTAFSILNINDLQIKEKTFQPKRDNLHTTRWPYFFQILNG